MTQPLVQVCYRPGEFVLPTRYADKVKPGRLASTPGDNLVELAGRLCYDSICSERGRPSAEYHAHIRETKHNSVFAHIVETFEAVVHYPEYGFDLLRSLSGRPGVWITQVDDHQVRFAVSLRAVLEWDHHGVGGNLAAKIGETIRASLYSRYPLALHDAVSNVTLEAKPIKRISPLLPQEKWVSLYLEGISRDLCYTPDTEILTRDGWKTITDIADDETLLTKDPATGVCRWSINKRLIALDYSGPVHHFENNEWTSPSITPDHTVWVGQYDLRRARGLTSRQIIDQFPEKRPYKEVAGKRFVVDHAIRHEGPEPQTVTIGENTYPAAEFFEWLGWVSTDGGCNATRKRVYVTQTKQRGIDRVTCLMDVLFAGRWRALDYRDRGAGWVGKIHDDALWQFIVDNLGRLKPTRRLTYLFRFGPNTIRHFLAGAEGGDGSVNRSAGDHLVVHCPYPTLAGDYQILYAMTGRSACVQAVRGREAGYQTQIGGVATIATRDALVVSVHKSNVSLVAAKHQVTEHYTGTVYCPQTDDGLVYVRRKGHGVWCGNCQELVRHHYQANPSVRSTRYVDESGSHQVLHPAVAECPELVEVVDYHAGNAKRLYEHVFRKLTAKGVDQKTARGAARSVLPGATETRLVYSLSEFQAKHILSLRADQSTGKADPEIVRAAGLMRTALRAEGWDV